jgi:hypothetical protein
MPEPPPVISTEAPSRSGNRADGIIIFVPAGKIARHGIDEAGAEGKAYPGGRSNRFYEPAEHAAAIGSRAETGPPTDAFVSLGREVRAA